MSTTAATDDHILAKQQELNFIAGHAYVEKI